MSPKWNGTTAKNVQQIQKKNFIFSTEDSSQNAFPGCLGVTQKKRPDILKNYYRVLSFYRIHMVCIVTCTMQPEYTIVHCMKVWYRCVYTYQHLIHFNFQYYLLFFSIYVLEQHDLQYEGKSVFKHRTIFPFSSYFCRPKVVHLIMFQGIGVFFKTHASMHANLVLSKDLLYFPFANVLRYWMQSVYLLGTMCKLQVFTMQWNVQNQLQEIHISHCSDSSGICTTVV